MKTDNELIAEFMGFDVTTEGPIKGITIHGRTWKAPFGVKPYYGGFRGDQLHQFETSWDWLMPVVKKIYNMNPRAFKYSLETGPLSPLAELHIFDNIGVIYKAVVEFIKWHNEQLATEKK